MEKPTEKEEEEPEKQEVAEMEQPRLVDEVKSLILLAIPLFLSSASWVRYQLAPHHLITRSPDHLSPNT